MQLGNEADFIQSCRFKDMRALVMRYFRRDSSRIQLRCSCSLSDCYRHHETDLRRVHRFQCRERFENHLACCCDLLYSTLV
eukprot:23886_5